MEEDQVLKLEYEDLGPGHIPVHAHPVDAAIAVTLVHAHPVDAAIAVILVHAHPVDEAIATTLVRPHLMDDDDILPIPVYPLDTATAHTPVHPL